jgi:hypothetical protein
VRPGIAVMEFGFSAFAAHQSPVYRTRVARSFRVYDVCITESSLDEQRIDGGVNRLVDR